MIPPSRAARHHVNRGAAVFRQGDPAAAVFAVESRRVRLARILADGTSLVLYVAETSDSFAEASLSADRYHCDAIAETDAVLLALPKADLLSALAADPAECLALALALAGQVFKWVAWFTGSKNAPIPCGSDLASLAPLKGSGFFVGDLLLETIGFRGALWLMAAGLALILLGVAFSLPRTLGKAKASKSFRELFAKTRSIVSAHPG